MNKLSIGALALAASMAAAPAKADLLFGVYAEAQYWMSDVSGGYGTNSSVDDLNFEDEDHMRFSLALHHPVPLIPNVRIETQDLSATSPFPSDMADSTNTPFDGELDLSYDAASFYYRFLDNTLVRIHAGVSFKRFDGYARDYSGRTWNINETIPTVYAMVGTGLPFTGLSAYIRGDFLAIDSSSLTDVEAALQFELFDATLVDGSIQVGYRVFNLDLDDVGGLYSDVEFKGPFVGFQLHF